MATEKISIPEPTIGRVKVTLVGTSPLIMHEWSNKAKQQIREKQQKKAMAKREARKPEVEYESAKIKNSKGELAIKAITVKKAIIGAARLVEGLNMTVLRVVVFVRSDDQETQTIKLRYRKEEMIEDVVRIDGGRTSDLRYRPYVYDWECDVTVDYNADVLSADQVLNLLKLAGFGGLCENRPSKSGGDNGTFKIKSFEGKK